MWPLVTAEHCYLYVVAVCVFSFLLNEIEKFFEKFKNMNIEYVYEELIRAAAKH